MAERIRFQFPWSPTFEEVAGGVWVVRGDLKRAMNVYLLADDGGVTAFDAGTQPMVKAIEAAAEKLGGLKRVVLGHADSDHRGSAPYLGAPVYCHPDELEAARAQGPFRDYWRIDLIEVPRGRWLYNHFLHRRWDGGPVGIAGTVSEGDEICGFEVIHFPGHAPGLIGLWRQSDHLVICSDTVYFYDSARLAPMPVLEREGVTGHETSVPHRAFNWDQAGARESVRKLASLEPAKVLAGHEAALEGDRAAIREILEAAADAAPSSRDGG